MELHFSRDELIKFERQQISQIVRGEDSLKLLSISHIVKCLYEFMTKNVFSIQEKSECLNVVIPGIIGSLKNQLPLQKCRKSLSFKLTQTSDVFTKISPILSKNKVSLIQKQLNRQFFNLYEHYLYIFDDQQSIQIVSKINTNFEPSQKKLTQPVDVNSISILEPFVSKIKEPQKTAKKK